MQGLSCFSYNIQYLAVNKHPADFRISTLVKYNLKSDKVFTDFVVFTSIYKFVLVGVVSFSDGLLKRSMQINTATQTEHLRSAFVFCFGTAAGKRICIRAN